MAKMIIVSDEAQDYNVNKRWIEDGGYVWKVVEEIIRNDDDFDGEVTEYECVSIANGQEGSWRSHEHGIKIVEIEDK